MLFVDHQARPATVAQALLAGDDTAPALIDGGRTLSYGELRDLVGARSAALALPARSVVVLHGETSIEYVVTYLALLDAGHVPLLAAQHAERLAAAWRPAAVIESRADGTTIDRTGHPAPALHPDLALLLSTSGSTGNPKLVRLSRTNVISNAQAIAEYLRLTSDDRGITSLPLHYCYGLSVLHSHLVAGAAVVLARASVVDPCFRDAVRREGVTNIAGVPHTYELAERAGAELLAVPSLRFLTVAGGRLAPDAVARWASRVESWGADFYVMYGQTEATARMAYLPPDRVRSHPHTIGVPIPGGGLRVDAPEGEVGELVYRGPNVMLGYAEDPTDLALGQTLDELRTGDLARLDPVSGLFEVVGRRSRFVKPFGLRIDLDALQADAADELELTDVAVAGDDTLVAVAAPGADHTAIEQWVLQRTGLPGRLVSVDTDRALPRTASGKIDHAAVLTTARARSGDRPSGDASVAGVFATVLGGDASPNDTFVSLGGDSLAYVECSIRLERVLGRLPTDWHIRPVGDLEAHRSPRRSDRPWWRSTTHLDTTVLLRAVAICLIVATHMGVTYFPGGAHLLLAVVGYNLSRFLLPVDDVRERVRAGARTVWRTAGPVVAWIAGGMLLFGAYSVGTLLLVNNYIGPRHHRDDHWHFWFIEVFVHLVVLTTGLLAIPAVRRLERRRPYAFVLALLAVALVLRYEVIEFLNHSQLRFRTHGAAFFFVLGWLVHRSRTHWQRAATGALAAATIFGFFDRPQREIFIIGCLLVLVWFREIAVPRPVVAPIALVSTSSLWILITHFTVWPPLVRLVGRDAALPIVIATGVGAWLVARALGQAARRARAWRTDRAVVTSRPGLVRMA